MRKIWSSSKTSCRSALSSRAGGEVGPERLLEDHARVGREPGPADLAHDRSHGGGRDGQVAEPPQPAPGPHLGRLDGAVEVPGAVGVGDGVGQPAGEALPGVLLDGDAPRVLDRPADERPQLVVGVAAARGGDHGELGRHQTGGVEVVEAGPELARRQVAGGAEEDDQVIGWDRQPARGGAVDAGRGAAISRRPSARFARRARRTACAWPQQLVAPLGLAAGGEALEQRGGQDVDGRAHVDRRLDRPAPLARVRHLPREVLEPRRLRQRGGGEVEQPRGDDRAPAPDLGDLADVDLVAVGVRVAQGRGLGVGLGLAGAGVGFVKQVEALGVGGHEPVLDPVVDHLHEVPGPVGPAVQVALVRGRAAVVAARRRCRARSSRSERAEDRIEALDRLCLAADHQAVAALEAEHAAARAHVEVAHSARRERLGSRYVVAVEGVAPVDDRVAALEDLGDLVDDASGDGRRDHDPDGARGVQRRRELGRGSRRGGALAGQLGHRVGVHVEHHALMAGAHEAAHDVRPHPAQSDHAELHRSAAFPHRRARRAHAGAPRPTRARTVVATTSGVKRSPAGSSRGGEAPKVCLAIVAPRPA